MFEPAIQEFMRRQLHLLLLTVAMIAVQKYDLGIRDRNNPLVRNRPARHVASQIAGHRNAMRIHFLLADVPLSSAYAIQQRMAFGRRHQWRNHKFARRDRLLQEVTQLASKHGVQNSIWQQCRTLRFDEVTFGIHAAGGHEAMHVRMNAEVASPCVQRRDDARFGTELLRIGE